MSTLGTHDVPAVNVHNSNGTLSPSGSDEDAPDYLSLKQSLSHMVSAPRPENFNTSDDDKHTKDAGLHINIPHLPMAADIALAALQ